MSFIMIMLAFFVIFILYLIWLAFWKPISEMINNIILGFYFLVYYISDLFKGKYQPFTFDKMIIEKQINFLTKKIQDDHIKIQSKAS